MLLKVLGSIVVILVSLMELGVIGYSLATLQGLGYLLPSLLWLGLVSLVLYGIIHVIDSILRRKGVF